MDEIDIVLVYVFLNFKRIFLNVEVLKIGLIEEI